MCDYMMSLSNEFKCVKGSNFVRESQKAVLSAKMILKFQINFFLKKKVKAR